MNKLRVIMSQFLLRWLLLGCVLGLSWSSAQADVQISNNPLFLGGNGKPLAMLVMGRDHKLYYEAYNDASDLNQDGEIDVGYKPNLTQDGKPLDYYGYFDSYKCYSYQGDNTNPSSTDYFTPISMTNNVINNRRASRIKTCSGNWSGDFLNYLTTSRIDALRRVLYGGYRNVDSATETILERARIPQDAHSWGKEYESFARDGYYISDYTPLSQPAEGTRHLFANTTLKNDTEQKTLLRVLTNSSYRIWNWVAIERPVAGDKCIHGGDGPNCASPSGTDTSHPNNNAEFNALAARFVNPGHLMGTSAQPTPSTPEFTLNGRIECSSNCNPYGSDDNYITVFSGTLNVTNAGTYEFAVDGDDAVEVMIDGTVVVGWYTGHGKCPSDPTTCRDAHKGSITLTSGAHAIQFRHEEVGGDDNYWLYWKGGDSLGAWQVVPSTSFSNLVISTYNRTIPDSARTDHVVRVKACVSGRLEPECKGYPESSPTVYKPTGLLHEYGETDRMAFGLLTGSFYKNLSGGLLRKNITSFKDEINTSTGQFITPSTAGSIVQTISNIRVVGFRGDYAYNDNGCNVPMVTPLVEGICAMWGNPVAEMMYESMRYFAGKTGATTDYAVTGDEFSRFNAADNLNLPKPAWTDPYRPVADGGYPYCSKPFVLAIADAPSFDTDQLPGVASGFGSGVSSDIGALNVANIGQTIWTNEEGGTKSIFIGQSGSVYDTAPTPKDVTSFGNIRGLAPEEPTRQGGYYAASVGYFGKTTGVRSITPPSGTAHVVKTDTFGIALSSPLPTIAIPVPNYTDPNRKTITVVPFAKSVGGNGINAAAGNFQPTNTIVDFFVETIANTGTGNSGSNCPSSVPPDSAGQACNGGRPYIKFRINYEDSEYGSDHDMDAIVNYTFTVKPPTVNTPGQLEIRLVSEYEAGSVLHHIGYVISGTTHDGVYLEVRDWNAASNSGNPSGDTDYFLDTPPAFTGTPPAPNTGTDRWNDGIALPYQTTRTFAPATTGTTSAAFIKHDPLWYAAKWGGFIDANSNNLPDQQGEWDRDSDGKPDSYFLVTNAGKLKQQLSQTFEEIISRTSSAAAVAVNSGSLVQGSRVYQARFNSEIWNGELRALSINPNTGAIGNEVWRAQDLLTYNNRQILTFKPSNRDGIPFLWPASIPTDLTQETGATALDRAQVNALNGSNGAGEARLKYLRGDAANENPLGNQYRKRTIGATRNILGDIVNSNPFYVGPPEAGYSFGDYQTFANARSNRRPMVYIGANDGMLHGFDANTGLEVFAYVPSAVYPNLNALTELTYNQNHQFYVDASPTVQDVQFVDESWHTVLVGGLRSGGRSYFALDVTDSGTVDSAGSVTAAGSLTEANAANAVLWEFMDPDLGLTFSQPSLVRLNDTAMNAVDSDPDNNSWVAVFGNGYNSNNPNKPVTIPVTPATTAVLFVVNVENGSIIKKIDLREGLGLSTPSVVDGDGDGTADFIYAGDLEGNLWRFDIRDPNPNNWTYAKLFTAKDANDNVQPITAAPQVTRHPTKLNTGTVANTRLDEFNYMVLFGTGKYLGADDVTNTSRQTFYGVWDDMDGGSCTGLSSGIFTTACFNRAGLQAQTFCPGNPVDSTCQAVVNGTTVTSTGSFTSDGKTYRVTSRREVDYDGNVTTNTLPKRGWYIDLKEAGERVPGDPLIIGSRVVFTSILPNSDPCQFGGTSWVNLLDAVTGKRLTESFLSATASTVPVTETSTGTGFAPSSVTINSIASAPTTMKAPDLRKSMLYVSTSEGGVVDIPIVAPELGRQSWRQVEFQ